MSAPRTLLLLTNQELWPGSICTQQFSSEKAILLHGITRAASKEPALRLQKFLGKSVLVKKCESLPTSGEDRIGNAKAASPRRIESRGGMG